MNFRYWLQREPQNEKEAVNQKVLAYVDKLLLITYEHTQGNGAYQETMFEVLRDMQPTLTLRVSPKRLVELVEERTANLLGKTMAAAKKHPMINSHHKDSAFFYTELSLRYREFLEEFQKKPRRKFSEQPSRHERAMQLQLGFSLLSYAVKRDAKYLLKGRETSYLERFLLPQLEGSAQVPGTPEIRFFYHLMADAIQTYYDSPQLQRRRAYTEVMNAYSKLMLQIAEKKQLAMQSPPA